MAKYSQRTTLFRRELLIRAGLGLPIYSIGRLDTRAGADEAQLAVGSTTPEGLLVRQLNPNNLESPFNDLHTQITPVEKFFVRSHFSVPRIEASEWRLRVEGAVEHTFEMSYAELVKMNPTTAAVTLECAGNGRGFLVPQTRGVQWGMGAVSTATWTGVPLAAVLKRAGVLNRSVDVILEGADEGEPKDPPKPTGTIRFARSIPISRARNADVLLAHTMNGGPLSTAHGFPVRAVVPSWYGVASVKWLTRIIVVDRPFNGHFQSVDYAFWERNNGLPTRVPVTEMQVKAQIARPIRGETIAHSSNYLVRGAAWTGDSEITKVEISVDGGLEWRLATLIGSSTRHAWRLWEWTWRTPDQPGMYKLLARATDSRGRSQPMLRQPDRENYMINHVMPVVVSVQ